MEHPQNYLLITCYTSFYFRIVNTNLFYIEKITQQVLLVLFIFQVVFITRKYIKEGRNIEMMKGCKEITPWDDY